MIELKNINKEIIINFLNEIGSFMYNNLNEEYDCYENCDDCVPEAELAWMEETRLKLENIDSNTISKINLLLSIIKDIDEEKYIYFKNLLKGEI